MIVTLTTDWQKADYYTGSLKGCLLAACSDLQIIDISHNIQPFNSAEAALILQQAYPHFPKGTVHIIGVNSEPDEQVQLVLVEADGHYFLAPDDGVLSLLLQQIEPDRVLALPRSKGKGGFRAMSAFADAVKALNENVITDWGKPHKLRKSWPVLPGYDSSGINGQIVYIDSFGNAHTNINKELFDRVRRGRNFEIIIHTPVNKINRISTYYSEVKQGELVAIFNVSDYLEIALYQADLAQLEGVANTSPVRVKFL
jgi:S-adenosylmethionine hydrolase